MKKQIAERSAAAAAAMVNVALRARTVVVKEAEALVGAATLTTTLPEKLREIDQKVVGVAVALALRTPPTAQ